MALVFFALIGMVLQQVTAATVGHMHAIQMKTFGAWIAENKLNELRLGKSLPKPRQYKEEVEFANTDWELVTQVITTNNPDIHRVEVEVLYRQADGNGKTKAYFMTGFVGRY